MAIIIPSKNTYDRQNPKVRDNVIERIEVGAVEVSPNNDYETTVYNENVPIYLNGSWQEAVDIYGNTAGVSDSYYQRGVFAGIKTYNIENYEIKIPKLKNNKYISKIYEKTNKDEENYIKTSLRYKKYNGTRNVTLLHEKAPNINTSTIISKFLPATQKNLIISYGDIIYESHPVEEKTVDLIKDNIVVEERIYAVGHDIELVAKVNGEDKTNLAKLDVDGTNENFYKLNISILVGYEKYYGTQEDSLQQSDGVLVPAIVYLNKPHTVQLTAEKLVAEQLEITIYGDTIGIDLTDKTVYINGETQKKVHSVDGNELMQTSNYIKDKNENITEKAIENMYGETRKKYERGKETATIRCSISDYYEFGKQETIENLIKTAKRNDINVSINYNSGSIGVIITVSVDKPYKLPINVNIKYKTTAGLKLSTTATIKANKLSAKKTLISNIKEIISYEAILDIDMSFKLYDQVIPMVYGADGQDRPMSTYQDGSAKVFQVLGSKKFYDGAVWQELSLQEVDKSEVL